MERIRQLVAALDRENTVDAEEAQAELIDDFGAEALGPLLEAAPAFGHFGRLCAIEVFTAVDDRRAAAVLIPWLDSDSDVVRAWSARALGDLGATEAVPELLTAWAASKARGTPPEYTEPVGIRCALAQLGARNIVLPERAIALESETHPWDHAWPLRVLPDVLAQLAGAGQLVLYFQCWSPDRNSWTRVDTGASPELDWSAPWETLVEIARRQTSAAVEALEAPPGTVATLEWIDRSDIDPM